ncbi:unnamed protein product [Heligmosomoides polygyrus]|uniref:Uncharacterized protein n=1 Tax=Heligmosomoides polygyrus TaxID=6339 RepID=A0A3P8A6U5_HELPZ|nr:unnamed protein product [Heligmosomoides polygyrus]
MIKLASLLMFLQPAAGELQFVVGLMYAGDIPPIRLPYPNDLNELELDIYPRGIGRLTEVGVKRVYELGRWLRRRYVTDHQLIPPNYSMPERLRPLTDTCDRFERETRFEEEEFREQFDAENVEWYERLEEDTGFSRFNSKNVETLFDVEKEIAQGLPQPAWLNQSHNGVTVLDWIRESFRKLAVFKVASEKRARFA